MEKSKKSNAILEGFVSLGEGMAQLGEFLFSPAKFFHGSVQHARQVHLSETEARQQDAAALAGDWKAAVDDLRKVIGEEK
jgi:hypothetical protein